MIIEVLHLLTEALGDDDIGVYAQFANLTALPSTTLPDSLSLIASQTDTLEVALGKLPKDAEIEYPVVSVTIKEDIAIISPPMSKVRTLTVPVIIQVGVRDHRTEDASVQAYYVMDAILKCLDEFHANENQDMRQINSVMIQSCTGVTHAPLTTDDSSSMVIGTYRIEYAVRQTL